MLYPTYRTQIEQAFKTRVFDTYGCGEGIQIAAQCGHLNNYHVHTPDVIVEYVDERGRPVEAGQPGNIVLTRLHPGPMPLIRYKLGDIGLNGGQSCGCGRGYELMASIQGRDTDIVTTPSGNRLIVHFFTGVLEHFAEIDSFQVLQEEPDAILLRIVPASGFGKESVLRIASALKARGASDLTIEIELVKEIPLTPAGKRRFVISKLNR
jgi:phenylacetate-CoA ligase